MFDHTLILAPGGQTVYFGETRERLNEYFTRNGAAMSPSANPAEFVITTVAASSQDPNGADWAQLWRKSTESHELYNLVSRIIENVAVPSSSDNQGQLAQSKGSKEFALPLFNQVIHVTKRHWISIWRNGSYNFSKLCKQIFFQLIVAFTFFKVGQDVNGLQNHALAFLIACWVIPALAADLQDIWFQKWAIFEARERNGIYDYKALLIALIAVETPLANPELHLDLLLQLLDSRVYQYRNHWWLCLLHDTPAVCIWHWILLPYGSSFPQCHNGGICNFTVLGGTDDV
jgi:ABC-2 type transporter.